jgi:hypothetical protein
MGSFGAAGRGSADHPTWAQCIRKGGPPQIGFFPPLPLLNDRLEPSAMGKTRDFEKILFFAINTVDILTAKAYV